MKRNDDTSSMKLTTENKKMVLDQIRENLMAANLEYVTYALQNEGDEDEGDAHPMENDDNQEYIEPSMEYKQEGAKMYLQLKRIAKPTDKQIKQTIRQHDAMARAAMKEYIATSDMTKASKAGKSAWLLYSWMIKYGQYGEASRVGSLYAKMTKLTLESCVSMKSYLQQIYDLKDSIDAIQPRYVHRQQFFTLVLTNLGEKFTNAQTGPFRSVYMEMRKANLKNKIEWDELEAELQAAWDEEYPDGEVQSAPASKSSTSGAHSTADEVALLVREAARSAVREYAFNTREHPRGRNRDRRNNRKGQGGKERSPDDGDSKKKRICFNMRDTGRCRYGDKCHFDHSKQDSGDQSRRKKKRERDEWSVDSDEDDEPHQQKKRRRGEAVFTAREVKKTNDDLAVLLNGGAMQQFLGFLLLIFLLAKTVIVLVNKLATFVQSHIIATVEHRLRAAVASSSKSTTTYSASEYVFHAASSTGTPTAAMIIDSGATCHVANSKVQFAKMRNKRKTMEYVSMNGHDEPIEWRGDLDVWFICSKNNKNKHLVTLQNVAYVPTSENSLFSCSAYLKSHHLRKPVEAPDNHVVQTHDGISIGSVDGAISCHGERAGELWILNTELMDNDVDYAETTEEKAYTGTEVPKSNSQ
jgi:hypothetical protein